MITKEDAVNANYGEIFHYEAACTPNRTERWRANGACKTWKSEPRKHEFRLPVKYGLRDYGYITETNADEFHKQSECPYDHTY